jgi:hypothetical protein
VDVEFHQAFVAHFQKQGLAGFLIRKIGTPHELIGLERLLAKRIQDVFAIFQHNCSCNPELAFMMNDSGDVFDLAVFKVSRRERVARHLFDNRSICEKIFLGPVPSSTARFAECGTAAHFRSRSERIPLTAPR